MLGLIGVPIAYVVVLAGLLLKKDPRGLGLSFLFFATAVMTGIWAIAQSRSSTAGIGMLGIPLAGALAGFLGLVFARWRTSAEQRRRAGAWVGLTAFLLLVSFNIAQGARERTKNRTRDAAQDDIYKEIARNREMIDAALKQNPRPNYLDSSIRARIDDREFLLAALTHDSISPGLLDTLANSKDMGIVLETIRNPNTTAETLTRVYRTQSYPDYFFQALAAHRHTPPAILSELYHRPRTITGLDIWFAGNPATPRPILNEISRTASDRDVIRAMLENPALDCGLLGQLGSTLMKRLNRDADDPDVMRVTERIPEICSKQGPRLVPSLH